MNNDELVQEIGTLLIHDPRIASQPWEHLVIIARMEENSSEVYGFAYAENGEATPTGPRNFDIIDKFEALCKAMQEPGKDFWKACLVRLSSSGRISIDFEYDHPEKWLSTPATVEDLAERLRPRPL